MGRLRRKGDAFCPNYAYIALMRTISFRLRCLLGSLMSRASGQEPNAQHQWVMVFVRTKKTRRNCTLTYFFSCQ